MPVKAVTQKRPADQLTQNRALPPPKGGDSLLRVNTSDTLYIFPIVCNTIFRKPEKAHFTKIMTFLC